ncbi:DNA_BRE_C domain containing protein [Comamonadaceae bacterium]
MNTPEKLPFPLSLDQTHSRGEVQALFPLESLQHLDVDSALRCQSMLGHGGTYGFWETPETMFEHMHEHMRSIDLRYRITAYLPKGTQASSALDVLLDEGVLWLTRLGLLLRLGPAGIGGTAKFKQLDATTISQNLYKYSANLVARGITRRLESADHSGTGFACAFTGKDVQEWSVKKVLRAELQRLKQLHGLGLWSDAPPSREFKGKTTTVSGTPAPRHPETKRTPFQPIPDDYMATMGPRVLWLIKDLGPNLTHLLESLPTMLGSVNANNQTISLRIARYFDINVWRDRNGQEIESPPFELRHGSCNPYLMKDPSQHDPFDWPPRHWRSVQSLAVILQSAHLWLALLIMAARVGEVATLGRDCVEFAQDGQQYANGRSYKASRKLEGKEREWPMPDILVNVFAQQIKLIEACERLARMVDGSTEMADLLGGGGHLWASLGVNGSADATRKLASYGRSLEMLAKRIGLPDKPGGKNLHPHRFRKTLARLAGLAIDSSQKVLMLLLGHEDVTTTLGYMQADPAFAKEVDDITRELRIMRGEALIEDMRAALRDPKGLPYGGHGGGGAPVLVDSVRAYEEELHRSGEEWGVDTARELAVLLTNNGESARLISAHVVCTKTAGEVGLCSNKKGAIVAGNCQQECRNHIEDKTGRRDTERVIPILVQHAQEHIANNDWLPLARDKKQLEQELKRYDDIGAQWRAKPEVRAILRATT